MGKIEDLVNQKFGSWTVVERDLSQKRPTKYFCKCSCGNISSVYAGNLKRGLSSQCRDCQDIKHSAHLIGNKFHYITYMSIEKIDGTVKARVKCDCGRERYIRPALGRYKSCGLCNLNNKKAKNINKYLEEGSQFGSLQIIKKINPGLSLAKCDCGNEIEVKMHHMMTEHPSCGCIRKNIRIEKAKKLIGMRIGFLKVINFLGMKGERSRASYLLKCCCGKQFERSISHLYGAKSCGCVKKKNAPRGSQIYNARLQEFEVASMKELFRSGLYTKNEISKIFNVDLGNTGKILSGKAWSHVK